MGAVVATATALAGLAGADGAGATAPVARFDITPAVPQVGQTVTFTNRSTDPDPGGRILRTAWDLNGDGTIDSFNATVTHVYTKPGNVTVVLRVVDNTFAIGTVSRVLQVVAAPPTPAPPAPPAPPSNLAPVASFSVSPTAPTAGEAVSFVSASRDLDGFVVGQLWDLDGDGQFDDAGGGAAQTAYLTPGPRTVSLQVTDDHGAMAVAFQTITVAGSATDPATASSLPTSTPAATSTGPRRLAPFPVIRLRGRASRRTTAIDLFSVRAVKGAVVRVRCHGHSCPYARKTVLSRGDATALRFVSFERKLRAGTTIEVFVTKASRLGKYTRLRIRAGAAPSRLDRCLAPSVTASAPIPCPAA